MDHQNLKALMVDCLMLMINFMRCMQERSQVMNLQRKNKIL